MGNKNFSYLEYSDADREKFQNLYAETFPEDEMSLSSGKDLQSNTSTKITVTSISDESGTILGETPFGQTVIIDPNKEEKGFRKLGLPMFEVGVGQTLDVVITKDAAGTFNGSLSAGFVKALKQELHDAIKKENCAFSVKIVSVCNGGFMVDLSGIKCFLPGSLAAANRIMNFADYVGRTINVMVEVYDQKREIFVVSFKKYLKKIIDGEVKALSFTSKYEGIVTGASNTGVFVEWEDIFTGIIPFEEANSAKLKELKAGDTVNFFVVDIKNPQRITLSVQEPNEKLKNIQELKDSSSQIVGESNELKTYSGEVTKLKTFGVFVKLENGLSGLIEKEKLVSSIDKYEVGQTVKCSVSSVDTTTLKVQLTEVK